jgi:hypothetical protein
VVWKRWGREVMHHLRISIRMSQKQGSFKRGVMNIKRTLRLKELQLAVEELKMRLGEDNLRDVVLTGARASTDIARLSHGIVRINALHLRGVADGRLSRHCDVCVCV